MHLGSSTPLLRPIILVATRVQQLLSLLTLNMVVQVADGLDVVPARMVLAVAAPCVQVLRVRASILLLV